MKKVIKKVFRWIFKEELQQLQHDIEKERDSVLKLSKHLEYILGGVGVAVDVAVDSPSKFAGSWAAICIQGERHDFVKFVDLTGSEIRDIHRFLQNFNRKNRAVIDASPQMRNFLKF